MAIFYHHSIGVAIKLSKPPKNAQKRRSFNNLSGNPYQNTKTAAKVAYFNNLSQPPYKKHKERSEAAQTRNNKNATCGLYTKTYVHRSHLQL